MKKQMELFDDGGLADEGNTIDPVSGNDVPVGSTQEEVRDDIPAQLSEGEFVLPADVVRYHGLEKIMRLRDEAKQGLQKMDDMGQMGNSEEAILDDDIPFSLEDLDMEDDGVVDYNVGGYVPQQPPTAIPSVYTPPQQAAVPTAPTVPTGQAVPNFQTFMQAPQGQAPENREYINPTTQERRTLTFIGGKSTVAIPEGFVPVSEYKPTEAVTSTTTTPTTTQVTQQDSGDTPSIGGLTSEEVRSGVTTAKDRFSITGSRGFDILNLLPGAQFIQGLLGDDIQGMAVGQKDPLSGPPTSEVQAARQKYENVLNTKITGYAGNQVGDLDVATGGVFDARGRAITVDGDTATGENGQRSYASFKDWKNDLAAGRESGWYGGSISKDKYDNLSEKGKANYDNYSDITGSIQHEVKETPTPKPTNITGPTPRPDTSSSAGTSVRDIFSDPKEQASREDRFGEAGSYMNKGGAVTKQMKKSGLTSKK